MSTPPPSEHSVLQLVKPRLALGAAFLLIAGATLAVLTPREAGAFPAADCSDDAYNLQPAIDAAKPGAVLTISGHCFGNFVIDKDLTLQGDGTTVLDGNGTGRVLEVTDDYRVSLLDLAITGGRMDPVPDRPWHGGGILVERGADLTLLRVTVEGNWSAGVGGGIAYFRGFGLGTLRIIDSIIRDNESGQEGGGLFAADGTVEVTGSTIYGNATPGYGGGVRNRAGIVEVENSTISANSGIGELMNGHGGTVRLSHVTVPQIRNDEGMVYLRAAVVSLLDCPYASATYFISDGFNVLGALTTDCRMDRYLAPHEDDPDTGLEAQSTDVFGGTEPSPLDWNGGPTPTHAIGPEDSAFDLVTACTLDIDQRGVGRPQGEACDAGSYEYEVSPPAPTAFFEAMPVFDAIGFNFYSPGAHLSVEVRTVAGGEVLGGGAAETDASGFGWLDLGFDLVTGNHITVTDTGAGTNRETTVVPLAFNVLDPDTDRLAGTAEPGTGVVVFVEMGEGGLLAQYTVNAGTAGDWSVVTTGDVDLTDAHGVSARIPDADGDTTLVHAPAVPVIQASPDGDVIGLWHWDVDGSVIVEIPGSFGPRSFTVNHGGVEIDQTMLGIDLQPGMTIVATGDDFGRRKELTIVGGLGITRFDTATDEVGGIAPAGTLVLVGAGSESLGGCSVEVPTDISGEWVTRFMEDPCFFDLVTGMGAIAQIFDDDGDSTFTDAAPSDAGTVLAGLIANLTALNGLLGSRHVTKAIAELTGTLGTWSDGGFIDAKAAKQAFDAYGKTVSELSKALEDAVKTGDTAAAAELQGAIDILVETSLRLAQESIAAAVARDGDPKEIAKAVREMAKADDELTKGHPANAIGHFGKAWDIAGNA